MRPIAHIIFALLPLTLGCGAPPETDETDTAPAEERVKPSCSVSPNPVPSGSTRTLSLTGFKGSETLCILDPDSGNLYICGPTTDAAGNLSYSRTEQLPAGTYQISVRPFPLSN